MSKGYVYVLSNPSMPGLVKIGKTTRLSGMRAYELYQTGVPTPFNVEWEYLSPNCAELEAKVHQFLSESRVSPQREFFAVTPMEAADVICGYLKEQVDEIVSEYLPDYVLSDGIAFVSSDTVQYLSVETGAHPADVAMAISLLTPEELFPALARWEARKAAARMRADREGSS